MHVFGDIQLKRDLLWTVFILKKNGTYEYFPNNNRNNTIFLFIFISNQLLNYSLKFFFNLKNYIKYKKKNGKVNLTRDGSSEILPDPMLISGF